MNRIDVHSKWREFRHAIYKPMSYTVRESDVTPEALSVEECYTPYGEPLCRCCTFILHWQPPEHIGQSDATDGANA